MVLLPRLFIASLLLAAQSRPSQGCAPPSEGDPVIREERTFTHAGVPRPYRIQRPSPRPGERFPVVMAFHGSYGSADNFFAGESKLPELAEEHDFILVAANGRDRLWRSDPDAPDSDVAFAVALLDEVLARDGGDPARVYATGISGGAGMVYSLGCDHAERFSALAPVAAGIGEELLAKCRPATPLSVVSFHGTADWMVPYDGGHVFGSALFPVAASEERSIDFWARNAECGTGPTVENLPDVTTADQSTARRTRYAGCAADLTVTLFTLVGGGHTWPGGWSDPAWHWLFGSTNQDINADDEMIAVFRRTRGHVGGSDPW